MHKYTQLLNMQLFNMQLLKFLLIFISSVILMSCGGGAGGTGGSGAATETISLTLKTITTSPSNVNSLLAGQAARAVAVYKSANGQPVPNALVTFTLSDATLVAMVSTNGTALTDSNGLAYIDIVGKSPNPGGVLSITAKATNGANTVTSAPWNVSVVASTVSVSASPSVTLRLVDSVTGAQVTNQAAGSTVPSGLGVLKAFQIPY